ncbi:MAG TPA: helix-turn-helix domain-containing protein [Marmoricola sp.]|nr:helix-turn-helix domain-containing protein [Marmoricola sp.]
MDEPLADVVGIAALADPLRRRLYRYVARSTDPVGREEAAAAVDVAVHTAKFHLDRMVADGLLEVEYRRLSGRNGPGAGRPAKLYRRAARDFSVSVPARHYDLLSDVLADAAQASVERRLPVDEVAPEVARRHGELHGAGWAERSAQETELDRLAEALDDVGYEPRIDDERMVLENCPFDRVAREHTELVCGLNLDFVRGVADGLGCAGVAATLEPSPGRCCVSAREHGAGTPGPGEA